MLEILHTVVFSNAVECRTVLSKERNHNFCFMFLFGAFSLSGTSLGTKLGQTYHAVEILFLKIQS